MGHQIVKQPNGRYSMWSTIVEDFIYKNLTGKQYIDIEAKRVYEDKKEELEKVFANLDNEGGYTMDYEQCLEQREWNK